MSEMRLVVRDGERSITGIAACAFVERVVAALSAEPETIDELDDAVERFEARRDGQRFFQRFSPDEKDETWDAGVLVIDLAARLMWGVNTFFAVEHRGGVEYHDGQQPTGRGGPYRIPDDWRIIANDSPAAWRRQAEARRQERAAHPASDPRPIVMGPPLLEFVARACYEAFVALPYEAPRDCIDAAMVYEVDEYRYDHPAKETIRRLHADWLLTAREDLGGRSPREALLEKKDFIDSDLHHRCHLWSMTGVPTIPLPTSSHAYLFAGVGTHQWVKYYYLVRELFWKGHDLALQERDRNLAMGDFLALAIPQLAARRDQYLHAIDPGNGMSASMIMENERRRMPEVMGHEHIIDHDCPLCRMMLDDSFGPTFWHLAFGWLQHGR